jgi:hypothetical protein
MIGTKLNAQVLIRNLQDMDARSLPGPPTGARGRMDLEHQDWARLQGRVTTHGRAQRPPTSSGVADMLVPRDGQ